MPSLILWGAPLTLLPGRLMVVEGGGGDEREERVETKTTKRKGKNRERKQDRKETARKDKDILWGAFLTLLPGRMMVVEEGEGR